MRYSVEINGLAVDAWYSEASVQNIFLPLLQRLTALYEQKQRRILVMLAAPPGAGKSTLADFLRRLSLSRPELQPVTVIGIDGFHRRQQYLLTHTAERGGEQVPMVSIKGAPVTFDLPALRRAVERVAAGEVCGWPEYNRLLHDPVEDAICVDGPIVLLEGNYLLLDEEGWRELRQFADFTLRITAEEQLLRSRLTERKTASGTPRDAAQEFVERSDLYNARLCLEHSLPADLELRLLPNDEYVTV